MPSNSLATEAGRRPTFAEQQKADMHRLAEKMVDQGEFDFLMPYSERRTLLAPQEVADCVGWSVHLIYRECAEGRLEVVELQGRKYAAKRITRRSVMLWLAVAALGDGREHQPFMDRVDKLLGVLTSPQLDRVIRKATQLRTRL